MAQPVREETRNRLSEVIACIEFGARPTVHSALLSFQIGSGVLDFQEFPDGRRNFT